MHVPEPFLHTKQTPYNLLRRPFRWVLSPRRIPGTAPYMMVRFSTYLVRERTPVTGELVVWLPLLTEPGSLLSGGLQYVVRFAPLLPPAIADTPTAHSSANLLELMISVLYPLPVYIKTKGQTHGKTELMRTQPIC